jgi:hypothetical protein
VSIDPVGVMLEDEVLVSNHSPYPAVPECTEAHCIRPPYLFGRCKRHADAYRYARMRELERLCRTGMRVLVVAGAEMVPGVALSEVRLSPRPGLTRWRWPSVVVRLDGHFEATEWPAIDVEIDR